MILVKAMVEQVDWTSLFEATFLLLDEGFCLNFFGANWLIDFGTKNLLNLALFRTFFDV